MLGVGASGGRVVRNHAKDCYSLVKNQVCFEGLFGYGDGDYGDISAVGVKWTRWIRSFTMPINWSLGSVFVLRTRL
jgi:hypothetical protein